MTRDPQPPGWRRQGLVAVAWLVAVLVGSGLAWVAVSRAGEAVIEPVAASGASLDGQPEAGDTTTTSPVTTAPAPAGQGAVPGPVITSVVPPPTTEPPATGGGGGGGAGGGGGGGGGGSAGGGDDDPDPGNGGNGGDDGSPAEPRPDPAPAPDPQPAAVSGSRSTEGGTLAVTCRGSAASLSYATPAAGWRVDVGDDPGEVRAEFSTGEGGEEREIEIRVTCLGGEPRFEVRRD